MATIERIQLFITASATEYRESTKPLIRILSMDEAEQPESILDALARLAEMNHTPPTVSDVVGVLRQFIDRIQGRYRGRQITTALKAALCGECRGLIRSCWAEFGGALTDSAARLLAAEMTRSFPTHPLVFAFVDARVWLSTRLIELDEA